MGTGVAVATSVAVGTGGVGMDVGSGVHVGTSVGSGIGALSLPPPQAASNTTAVERRSSRMTLIFIQPYYQQCLRGATFQLKESLGCSTLPVNRQVVG